MAAQIQIFAQSSTLVRARMLFPQQQVETALTLAPGDDPRALLQAEYTRLAPTYAGAHDAAKDLPALAVPVLATFDGTTWA